jgi:hypothetical protein
MYAVRLALNRQTSSHAQQGSRLFVGSQLLRLTYIVEWDGRWGMRSWKGCGRKRLWPN